MHILAIDASLSRCSVALLGDGRLLAQRVRDGDRGHAAALPPMAAAVLEEAGLRATDLDAVAAVVGPGGFTGLRAALALAHGIALGAGLPVIGVTTGEALAAALSPEDRAGGRAVWAAVDNRRGRVVLERFARSSGGGADAAPAPPEVFAGDDLPPALRPHRGGRRRRRSRWRSVWRRAAWTRCSRRCASPTPPAPRGWRRCASRGGCRRSRRGRSTPNRPRCAGLREAEPATRA